MTENTAVAQRHMWTLALEVFVKVDRLRDFQEALPDINAKCARVKGFLGQSVDSAPPEHGSALWVINLKFASEESREKGRALLEEAFGELSDMEVSAPVLVTGDEGPTERTVELVTSHVRPGRHDAFIAAQGEMNALVARAPGFIGLETFPPSGNSDTWVTSMTFDSAASLDAWMNSPERAAALAKLHDLTQDDVRTVPTGFGQWYKVNATAMSQTPAWKQAMTVLAALAPTVAILNMTIGDYLGRGWNIDGQPIYKGLGIPFPVIVFIGNAIGTILLTWVLMPIVTRAMAWWLDPGVSRKATVIGIFVMLVVYGLEITMFTAIWESLGI